MKQMWQWLKEHIKLVSLVMLVIILGLWQLWPAPPVNNDDLTVNSQTTAANSENSVTDTKTINLNTADVTELQNLPGVGPKKAELIIQYRQEKGSFSKIEDLTEVQGIGEKTFAKIKSQLTV